MFTWHLTATRTCKLKNGRKSFRWKEEKCHLQKQGEKTRDGQKRRKGEQEKNVNFELWRDLLSLDEGDDWAEV